MQAPEGLTLNRLYFALLLLVTACGAGSTPHAPHPPELVGEYKSEQISCFSTLRLQAGGSFEAEVWTGLTEEGCGTFEGAGGSTGTWRLAGGRIVFSAVREHAGLALKYSGASAQPSARGLLLSSGGKEYDLVRSQSAGALSSATAPIELTNGER